MVLALAALSGLGGCASIGYYAQAVSGHLQVMGAARPVDEVLRDPTTPVALRGRLETLQRMRDFASRELHLPDNGSYRSYADIGRRFVVWTVVATPELDLRPRQWCFAVAGCLAYRGYYAQEEAGELARQLRAAGDDVHMGGVRAYSTLGWFDDPVLNSMVEPPPPYLAGVLFHELAHQQLYVDDDSAFNEAFATAVQREGVRRWLAHEGDTAAEAGYRQQLRYEAVFLALVDRYRSRLQAVYGDEGLDAAAKRAVKQRVLDELRAQFEARARDWPSPRPYAGFFDAGLNNARLAAVATYHRLVPAFEHLLSLCAGDLRCLYARSAAIGALEPAARSRLMDAMLEEVRS